MNVNIAVRPARSHGHGKRFWLKALILAAVSSASPGEPLFLRANAQEFPSRRIEIVAPFPAGGSADLFARVVAQKISNSIGHPVIIEPKPGASGIIGTRSVIDAAPAVTRSSRQASSRCWFRPALQSRARSIR
jgi:tripartite-type tricarboxylate transporter receptor subunit TctC